MSHTWPWFECFIHCASAWKRAKRMLKFLTGMRLWRNWSRKMSGSTSQKRLRMTWAQFPRFLQPWCVLQTGSIFLTTRLKCRHCSWHSWQRRARGELALRWNWMEETHSGWFWKPWGWQTIRSCILDRLTSPSPKSSISMIISTWWLASDDLLVSLEESFSCRMLLQHRFWHVWLSQPRHFVIISSLMKSWKCRMTILRSKLDFCEAAWLVSRWRLLSLSL